MFIEIKTSNLAFNGTLSGLQLIDKVVNRDKFLFIQFVSLSICYLREVHCVKTLPNDGDVI